MSVNVKLDVDVVETAKYIEDVIDRYARSGSRREAFVKDLLEKLSFQRDKNKEKYNILIFNMQQPSANGLQGVLFYQSYEYDGTTYGVWLFEDGWFHNKGQGTYQNWGMSGWFDHSGPTVKGGEMGSKVEFQKG